MAESSGSPDDADDEYDRPQRAEDPSPAASEPEVDEMSQGPSMQPLLGRHREWREGGIEIDLTGDDADDETSHAEHSPSHQHTVIKMEPGTVPGDGQPADLEGTDDSTFAGMVLPETGIRAKPPVDVAVQNATHDTETTDQTSPNDSTLEDLNPPEFLPGIEARELASEHDNNDLPELPPDTGIQELLDESLAVETPALDESHNYMNLAEALGDYLQDVNSNNASEPGQKQPDESYQEQCGEHEHGDDPETEDKDESARFQKLKKHYEACERAGTLTTEQEVRFRRAQDGEKRRQKALGKKRAWREANEMFVGQDGSEDDVSLQPAPPYEEASSRATIRQPRVPKTSESGYSELGQEASDTEVEATTPAPEPPKKRGRPPKGKQHKVDAKSKVWKKSAKEPKSKGKKGRKGQEPLSLVNLSSLYHNDIVAQAQANQGREAQPGFTATNKQEALKQLISSIPEEHRKPFKATKNELDRACKKFGHRGPGSMHADGAGGWRLKGMTSSLYHYQLLGAAWCVDREASSVAPFGGMVSDSMGFGKTITMLSVILEGLPKSKDRWTKKFTTLIVCPSTLCSQWLNEIKKHINDRDFGEVLLYRSGSRVQSSDPVSTISKYTIVITSYPEIMSQYPKCEPPKAVTQEGAQVAWWAKFYEEHKGPLLRVPFRRVVLDEAQTIKNPAGRTSRACRALTAKYRWTLSGTPILNCLEELFSYFNFLGVEGAGTFEQYKHNYCKRTPTCMERLDSVLRKVMIRRTGADEMFGRPILQLPALKHETIMLDFHATERAIYSIVKHRFITKINQWSVEGVLQKKHRNIFVMLLRLRQMCAHVFIIFDTIKELLETEDMERLWKLTDEETQPADPSLEPGTLTVLRRVLAKARNAESKGDNAETPDRDEPVTEVVRNTLTGPGANEKYTFKFRKVLRKMWDEGEYAQSNCKKCYDIADQPRVAPCGHLYCLECIFALIHDAKREGRTKAMCLECSEEFSEGQELRVLHEIESNDRGTPSTVSSRKRKHGSVDTEGDGYNWLYDSKAPFLSSKVQAIRTTIDDWFKKDPSTKIIVFSLFLPMLAALERVATLARWGYCSYTGKMSADAKDRSISDFSTQPDKSILFASLRAGGLGLNLTMASKCIIVDPWWNECTEDQAFSRVFRIGQTSAVEVRRFVINDTIDTQLLLKMQQRKTREIKHVMGDGRDTKNLSVQDLMRLFGPVRKDPETGMEVVEESGEEENAEAEFVFAEDQYVQDDSDAEGRPDLPERPWAT